MVNCDAAIVNVLSKMVVLVVNMFRPRSELVTCSHCNGSRVVLKYLASHFFLFMCNREAFLFHLFDETHDRNYFPECHQ